MISLASFRDQWKTVGLLWLSKCAWVFCVSSQNLPWTVKISPQWWQYSPYETLVVFASLAIYCAECAKSRSGGKKGSHRPCLPLNGDWLAKICLATLGCGRWEMSLEFARPAAKSFHLSARTGKSHFYQHSYCKRALLRLVFNALLTAVTKLHDLPHGTPQRNSELQQQFREVFVCLSGYTKQSQFREGTFSSSTYSLLKVLEMILAFTEGISTILKWTPKQHAAKFLMDIFLSVLQKTHQ